MGSLPRPWSDDGAGSAPPASPQARDNLLDRVPAPTLGTAAVPRGANMPAPQLPVPAATTAAPRRAVLLLPLSGQHAALGHQLLQAAQLAVQDLAPENLTVMPYDTNRGAAAVLGAALQSPADVIIGPLFSVDVAATKGIAAEAGVPMIGLSNDQSQVDKNTYLMGAWPGDQIARVVDYATASGIKRIVAILPDNAYGQAANSVIANNMALVDSIGYAPQAINVADIVRQVSALRGRYDAVLLPEGGSRAVQVAIALRQAGLLDGVRLLGSSQWDQRGDQGTDDGGDTTALNGGWYATTDKEAERRFAERYQSAFGELPPPLASVAYDATALAAVVAARNWAFDMNTLTQSQGFGGMAGAFRLQPGGYVERALSVQEISASGRKVLQPAPTRFSN